MGSSQIRIYGTTACSGWFSRVDELLALSGIQWCDGESLGFLRGAQARLGRFGLYLGSGFLVAHDLHFGAT